jgi:hypothetical protein
MSNFVKSLPEFLNEDGGPPQGPSIVTVPGNWGATYVNSRNYHPMGVAQLPMVVDPLYNSENVYNYLEFMNANKKWMEGPKSFAARMKRKEKKKREKKDKK